MRKFEQPDVLRPVYFNHIPRQSAALKLVPLEFLFRSTIRKMPPGFLGINAFRKFISLLDDMLFVATGIDHEVDPAGFVSVEAEWVSIPRTRKRLVLFYLHGGAFVFDFKKTQTSMVAYLCNELRCRALLVKYRLAPENKFPAALDDCLAAYLELLDSGVLSSDVVFLGDSAGGNLVLATLMRARDLGLDLPAAAICLSPAVDFSLSGSHVDENEKKDPLFTKDILHSFAKMYLPDMEMGHQPDVSPICGDFSGLPPLLFQVGTHEILMDDSLNAASRAYAAGCDVQLDVFEGMPHVFQVVHGLREAMLARKRIVQFIREINGKRNTA